MLENLGRQPPRLSVRPPPIPPAHAGKRSERISWKTVFEITPPDFCINHFQRLGEVTEETLNSVPLPSSKLKIALSLPSPVHPSPPHPAPHHPPPANQALCDPLASPTPPPPVPPSPILLPRLPPPPPPPRFNPLPDSFLHVFVRQGRQCVRVFKDFPLIHAIKAYVYI
jgi:hypothetical protein